MSTFEIRGVKIGEKERCFVIAEAGVNHNGSVDLAKKLIDAAKKAGADVVKFQTFRAETLVTKTAKKADYQKVTTGDGSQFAMLKKLEMSQDGFIELFAYAKKQGIMLFSTPFDEQSADFLEKLGVPVFKIPSGEITNYPLLENIAKKGKPIILSTGMSNVSEIKAAVNFIHSLGNKQVAILHCVSDYPAKIEDINLRFMQTLQKELGILVGFSDHTTSVIVPALAVAMGARIIEKHFTLDKKMDGPDHKASLEPEELAEMIRNIRDAEKAIGTGKKVLTNSELRTKEIARKSIVSAVWIQKGTVIERKHLEMKRPGIGIPPNELQNVLGKKARKDILPDELITLDMIS